MNCDVPQLLPQNVVTTGPRFKRGVPHDIAVDRENFYLGSYQFKLDDLILTLFAATIPFISEYPPTWTQPMDGDKTCHLYEVPEGTDEFTDATKEFCEKMGTLKFTIVKVQRVQNPNIYACYDALRRTLRRKYSKAVVERRLFHGTKFASIEPITHQGFNRNFAADANGKL